MTPDRVEDLKRRVKERLTERRRRVVAPSPPPRYDGIFFEAIENVAAGEHA